MPDGLIHLTPAADACLRAFVNRHLSDTKGLLQALVEAGDCGQPSPTDSAHIVWFPGPWLAMCGYPPEQIKSWPVILLFGATISLHPELPARLSSHMIDEKTICDPVSGLSHTGLYLRQL